MTDPLVNNDLLPLSYCKVVGRFLGAVADSTDTGSNPDAIPLTGKITIAPNVRGAILVNQAQPDPATVVPAVITVTLDDEGYLVHRGQRGVWILAPDQFTNPANFNYTATFELRLEDRAVQIPPFAFNAPISDPEDPETWVDLTLVGRVASAVGESIIRGEEGTGLVTADYDTLAETMTFYWSDGRNTVVPIPTLTHVNEARQARDDALGHADDSRDAADDSLADADRAELYKDSATTSAAAAQVHRNAAGTHAAGADAARTQAEAFALQASESRLVWRGDWAAGTAYAIRDAVHHLGSTWRALTANTGIAPTEGTDWALVAERGLSYGDQIKLDTDGVPYLDIDPDYSEVPAAINDRVADVEAFAAAAAGSATDAGTAADRAEARGLAQDAAIAALIEQDTATRAALDARYATGGVIEDPPGSGLYSPDPNLFLEDPLNPGLFLA